MLNNITNYTNLINNKKVRTLLDATDLFTIGVRDANFYGNYQPALITATDLVSSVASLLPPATGVINTIGTTLYSVNPAAGPVGPLDNIAFGLEAGQNATTAEKSNFIGFNAGKNSSLSNYDNFFGRAAGENATGSSQSNFIGNNAGKQTNNTAGSNFIGGFAGQSTSNSYDSNFIGRLAGYESINAFRSNFIGQEAGSYSSGNNVNAFGHQAHRTGTLSGQTVFSNASFASYTNRTAATTAITVPNGARAGNTYLYYNQTTFAIEAVRL